MPERTRLDYLEHDAEPVRHAPARQRLQEPVVAVGVEVDRILVAPVIAVRKNGRKIGEMQHPAVVVYHPFDLEPVLKAALERTKAEWEKQSG